MDSWTGTVPLPPSLTIPGEPVDDSIGNKSTLTICSYLIDTQFYDVLFLREWSPNEPGLVNKERNMELESQAQTTQELDNTKPILTDEERLAQRQFAQSIPIIERERKPLVVAKPRKK